MLFLADSEEDSGCREVALVILVTCPSVLEQDAEAQNAACDWLRGLRTEMSSPDTVNAHGRQIRREKLTGHSRNVPPPIHFLLILGVTGGRWTDLSRWEAEMLPGWLTLTSRALQSLINLTCILFNTGRKQEHPENVQCPRVHVQMLDMSCNPNHPGPGASSLPCKLNVPQLNAPLKSVVATLGTFSVLLQDGPAAVQPSKAADTNSAFGKTSH